MDGNGPKSNYVWRNHSALTKLRRRYADDTPEKSREMALIAKPGFCCDQRNGHIGTAQKALGPADALRHQELMRREAETCLELTQKMETAKVELGRHIVE